MSTVEPDGTWQYPHSVCCPSGALLGSTTPGCATRQNGCSGCLPAATSDSLRATSANVPPRCTVPASRQAGACQGTGPLSAQSTLQTPGPYRKRSSALRCLAGSRSPASAMNWRGDTSSSTARACGRSSSVCTQRPVSTLPPSDVISATRASVSRALPPSTTGQPTECAVIRNSKPKALVSGAVSGSMVCAAAPAISARACSPRNRRDSTLAGQQALQAEPGHGHRMPGDRPQRSEDGGQDEREVMHQGPEQLPVGVPVWPEPPGRLVYRSVGGRCPAAVQWLGEGHLRGQQPDPVRRQVGAGEERRGAGQRVDRRADVVTEPG